MRALSARTSGRKMPSAKHQSAVADPAYSPSSRPTEDRSHRDAPRSRLVVARDHGIFPVVIRSRSREVRRADHTIAAEALHPASNLITPTLPTTPERNRTPEGGEGR